MISIARFASSVVFALVLSVSLVVHAQVPEDVLTDPMEDADGEVGTPESTSSSDKSDSGRAPQDENENAQRETSNENENAQRETSNENENAQRETSNENENENENEYETRETSNEKPVRRLPAGNEEDVSDAEMAELEAALGADAEAVEEPESTQREGGNFASAVQSMNPDIAVILDVAAAYFTDEPDQVGAHDPSRTGFNLQQLEMYISSNVDPYFKFEANLVFAEFGVEVEEAYFTTLALPANLQVRGGQFLTRFGRLNPTHPHSWTFLDQPLVNGKFFGGEGSRGLGVETSWLTPLPWYVELVGSSTMANQACCARSFFGGNDPGVDGIEDLLYTTALKQFFALSDDWSLMWGVSAQFGPNSTGNQNRTEIYGSDLYLKWRPVGAASRTAVSLQIEGMYRTRQVPDDRLEDWGGYAHLAWTINPEWETAARYEYVTGVEDDYLEEDWFEDRQRAALQLTYFPSHFSRIRLQTSRDDPEYRNDAIWAVMLGVEVLVGAHGAHTY